MRAAAYALLLFGCTACGPPGPLFLTIQGELAGGAAPAVPEVVDGVSVQVFGATAVPLYERAFELDAALHLFPLTLALETGPQTPTAIRLRVGLGKQGRELAFSEAGATLVPQQVNQLTMRVVLPAP